MMRETLNIKSAVRILMCISILALLSFSCKDAGVQPTDNTFALTVADASCTEVYLSLKIGVNITSRTVTLKRDTITLFTKTIDAAETVIADTNLLPNHIYNYTAQLLNGSTASSSTARTMDTTSHSFSWQTFTLGDGTGSSVLYDVAIIGDTIWVVGEIFSGGTTYNYAIWNGNTWTLGVTSDTGYGYGVLYCIYAFGPNDIWVGSSILEHWDGSKWTFYGSTRGYQNAFTIRKIWSTSSNSLYFVGDVGNIRYFNGTSWTKIESGTTLMLNDVWGGNNKWLGGDVVLVPASEKYTASEKKLIRIVNGSVKDLLPWPMQDRRIHSVWFDQHSPVFTSGGGVFRSKFDGTWSEMSVPLIYTNRIRGNASNDLITVGDFGIVGHYNGVGWKVYDEIAIAVGNYESVSTKDNLIVAVGFSNAQAIVALGKRN